MWSNADEMLGAGAGHADPGGEQVGPLPLAARGDPRARVEQAADGGFQGLMTFTLPESLWLHEHGFDDLLLAYPTADRAALAVLRRIEDDGAPILMVDSVEHLDLIESAAGGGARPIRVCIEVDLSWWPLGGRVKIGVKRSPIRTPRAGAGARPRDRAPARARARGADGL